MTAEQRAHIIADLERQIREAVDLDLNVEDILDKRQLVDVGQIYRFYGVCWSIVLAGWGVWMIRFSVYETSETYSALKLVFTENEIGLIVLCISLSTLVFPLWSAIKDSLSPMVPLPIMHGMIWGGITGFFYAGNPASTGVWIYGALTVMCMFASGHIYYLRG